MLEYGIVKKIRRLPANIHIHAFLFLASLIATFPLWSEPGFVHRDLSVPARFVYEYYLALKEGQWLPLVSPEQNGAIRNPIFQYYTGTAFLLPAIFMLLGLPPDYALIAQVVFWCFAGPVALYHVARKLGASIIASVVATLIGLFYPLMLVEIHANGLYVEWVSVAVLPVVLYALIGLITTGAPDIYYKIRLVITSLLIAYYIPLHPSHSIYSFSLVVLLACVHAYAQRAIRSMFFILSSIFLGGVISAWYWLSIAQTLSHMRMSHELGFISIGSTLADLLWPVFRPVGDCCARLHAVQIGWYFFALSILTIVLRRSFRIGVIASILYLAVVLMATIFREYPNVVYLYRFIQWDYRIPLPLGLVGAVVTADFLVFLQGRNKKAYNCLLLLIGGCVALTAWQYSIQLKYKLKAAGTYVETRYITDPKFYWENSYAYAFFGSDFRNMDFTKGDISTNHYNVPRWGAAYTFTLKVRSSDASDGSCPLKAVINNLDAPQTCVPAGDGSYLLSGTMPGGDLHFTKPVTAEVKVEDYYFRSAVDAQEKDFRVLPGSTIRTAVRGGVSFSVVIPHGKAGLYQFPVAYWFGLGITVNGKPASQQSSDEFMVVTALNEGENNIVFYNRWTLAKTVSVIGLLISLVVLAIRDAWLQRAVDQWLVFPFCFIAEWIARLREKVVKCFFWASRGAATLIQLFSRYITWLVKKRSTWLEASLIAFLPCLLLFDLTKASPPEDWANHLWMIGYNGTYFRNHFSFPPIINTHQLAGLAYPVFYGFGLYPVLGLLSTVFYPHITVIIVTYGLYWLQCGSLILALVRLNMPRWFARIAALIVTFAVYPLTNLYNRSDLSEFFSTMSLSIALVALVLSIVSERPGQRRRWYAITLLAFGFMAVSHPLTVLNAAVFMALFCPLFLFICHKYMKRAFFAMLRIPLVLSLLLSPWLYAYYAVAGQLAIVMNLQMNIVDDSLDWIRTRLSPVLFERRLWTSPSFSAISTPFLDAPANIFLLALALMLAVCAMCRFGVFNRLALFTVSMTALFIFYVWCSVSHYPWDFILPSFFRITQMSYRMVTFINMSALGLLLGGAVWLKGRNSAVAMPQASLIIAVVLCTVTGQNFILKMMHAFIMRPSTEAHIFMNADDVERVKNMPGGFFGDWAYITPAYFMPVDFAAPDHAMFNAESDNAMSLESHRLSALIIGYGARFDPLCRNYTPRTYGMQDLYDISPLPEGAKLHENAIYFALDPNKFGKIKPYNIHSAEGGWHVTDIYPFAWNTILVDGKAATLQFDRNRLFVYLLPGDHVLEYVFSPPLLWVIFNHISVGTAILLLFYLICPRVFMQKYILVKTTIRNRL